MKTVSSSIFLRIGYTVTLHNQTEANNILDMADTSTFRRSEFENEVEKNVQSMPDLGSVTVLDTVGNPSISCSECPRKLTKWSPDVLTVFIFDPLYII